jgi:hypothetical protein
MENSKEKNLDTHRRMWGFTGLTCYFVEYLSIIEYIDTGKIISPKGPHVYEGKDALFYLFFFGGLAVISTFGYIYCYLKTKKIW